MEIKLNNLKTQKTIGQIPFIKNRITYQEFVSKHKENIVNCTSNRPLISPNDWKETIYIITKYYPI